MTSSLSWSRTWLKKWQNLSFWKSERLSLPDFTITFSVVFSEHTLSVMHSESRKTEQVTMKANFIYFWSVESEFVIKNSIFPWTSELAWIWHFLRKLDYFWLFLSTLVLATLVTKLSLSIRKYLLKMFDQNSFHPIVCLPACIENCLMMDWVMK